MVYESDFYTTRRPYRASPSVSSYTVSSIVPSRQVRILPGIGKVHVVHSYDRMIPYIGHKRLTVIPSYSHPRVFRVRPSVIVRELDRISHKARPYIYYTPSLVHSEPLTYFDSEANLIRAQSNLLLKTIHAPVSRVRGPWITHKGRYPYELTLPARITSDDYIHRMLTPIKAVKQDIYNISHFINDPIRRSLGPSHLACVRYGGDKAYSRRRNLTLQEIYAMQSDTVRNDIQLLSYYINANKERKVREGTGKASATSLNAMRPSRHFSKQQMMLEPSVSEEVKELREQRAERMRKIQELEDSSPAPAELEATRIKRSTKKQEEERLAEERALAEEKAKKEAAAKKEKEARRAELARQEAQAAQAAAERQAELDRQAELAKKAAEEKAAEEARVAAEAAAEKARVEAEKAAAERAAAEAAEKAKLEEEKRQEEERQALLRLEEIQRQAEEEKENELARQAEELAELARQEAELVEQAKREAELAELAKQEAELAELERQEKELAELDRQERDAAEAAKVDAELAEQSNEEAEVAAAESNIPAEETTTEEEVVTSDPEPVTSPEPAAEAEVTESEPEPLIEEPDTPEVEEDAE